MLPGEFSGPPCKRHGYTVLDKIQKHRRVPWPKQPPFQIDTTSLQFDSDRKLLLDIRKFFSL